MQGRNLYIFSSGRGTAGWRIGKASHMRTNHDGLFKSKRIIVFPFCKAKQKNVINCVQKYIFEIYNQPLKLKFCKIAQLFFVSDSLMRGKI